MLPSIFIPRKNYDAHKEHFILRLKERYNMDLSDQQYDLICDLKYIKQNFKGKFKKGSKKTIGLITINNIDVVVLYNNDIKSFDTCYPSDALINIDSLIRAAIIRPMRPFVRKIYDHIVEICEKEYRNDFENDNEAGKYFFLNCTFPNILISRFRFGGWDLIKIIKQIQGILYDKHPIYEIELSLNKKEIVNI